MYGFSISDEPDCRRLLNSRGERFGMFRNLIGEGLILKTIGVNLLGLFALTMLLNHEAYRESDSVVRYLLRLCLGSFEYIWYACSMCNFSILCVR